MVIESLILNTLSLGDYLFGNCDSTDCRFMSKDGNCPGEIYRVLNGDQLLKRLYDEPDKAMVLAEIPERRILVCLQVKSHLDDLRVEEF